MIVEHIQQPSAEAIELLGGAPSAGSDVWIARNGDQVLGAVAVRGRPDGRRFARFGDSVPESLSWLGAAVAERGGLHAIARSAGELGQLIAAGFVVEIENHDFEIRFDDALLRLGRPRLPDRFSLVPPHELDEKKCLALDNELRQDVPGTDGWIGTLEMWRDELASAEYDPSGYLVAVERPTGKYCGLIRVWRNDDGPRIGLLGVSRSNRGSPLAAALLQSGLAGAATWGSATFRTSTSPSNPGTYPALRRMGATPVATFWQLKYGN